MSLGRLLLGTLIICMGLSAGAADRCRSVFERTLDELTLPYGFKNRGPHGERTRESADNPSLAQENRAADLLTLFGFRVRQNPQNHEILGRRQDYRWQQEAEGLNPNRSPDYWVNEHIFDHYAPVTGTPVQIVNGIMNKVNKGQTHRVLVDLTANEARLKREFHFRDLIYTLRKKANINLWEVIVLDGPPQTPRLVTIWPEVIEHPLLESP